MDCPLCGLVNPASAQSCDCGFNFERDAFQSFQVRRARPRDALMKIVLGIVMILAGVGITPASIASASVLGSARIYRAVGMAISGCIAFMRGLPALMVC
jgi:hypothetical protein